MVASRTLSASNRPPPANQLLAALPADVFARIAPTLHVIPLKVQQLLYSNGELIDDVYFPGGGFISIVTVLEDGGMVEVATIGREGMVGISAVLNGDVWQSAAMVQAETDICYRMSARAFHVEMERRGPFHDLVTRYIRAIVGFMMRSTACNAVHSVEQRLARWLLLAHDRIGTDEFPLTQEFVAMMLGASRSTVTLVAARSRKLD
jgi:CRP-like cAMP-binding protein